MKRNKNFLISVDAVKMILSYLRLSFLETVRYIQNTSGRLVKFDRQKKRRRVV